MFVKKFYVLLLVLLSLPLTAGAEGCDTQQRRGQAQPSATPAKPAQPTPATKPITDERGVSNGEIKILSQNNYSPLTEPFVFVARGAETYTALRELSGAQLPEMSADFFKTRAVVAAFLGQRNSGGFGVEISRAGESSFTINERAPAEDAIVTMALTSPSLVASVPVAADEALNLTLGAEWQGSVRPYRVNGGELTVTGGIAGVNQPAQLTGDIGMLRAGKFATFLFDLKTTGSPQARALNDTATGFVEAGGRVRLPRFSSSSLTGAIDSPFRATGQFVENEDKLSLTFETVPAPNIADNFSASGRLEATATAQKGGRRQEAGGRKQK
ncbi:MAG: protease complex subunit PrcB family protein [Pyrinomonadaceae bacterium]|nr:protease complex subunit PrcB family protein [Pyrinomonadaceae bacterium]